MESEKWELKLAKDDVKVFIKRGGTEWNSEMPYLKTEVVFNSHISMSKIIKAVRTSFSNFNRSMKKNTE